MTKIKKAALTFVMGILVCFSIFCASGCALFDTSVEGTYYFYKFTYEEAGVTGEVRRGDKFGYAILEKEFCMITLNEDGTGSFGEMGESVSVVWTKENDVITLTDPYGYVRQVHWEPGKITYTDSLDGFSMHMTLKK